jgi:acyl carrier protein
METQTKQLTVTDVQAWLVSYLSQLLEINPDEINATTDFDRYGLDSSAAIGLTSDFGNWLGFELDPTLTYDYPTIETLAGHVVELSNSQT